MKVVHRMCRVYQSMYLRFITITVGWILVADVSHTIVVVSTTALTLGIMGRSPNYGRNSNFFLYTNA